MQILVNNAYFTLRYRRNSVFSVPDSDREDSVEDGSAGGGRKTVTSTIKFRPTSRDNKASYACEAQHPAIGAGPPMRVAVVLSVQCECQVTCTTGCTEKYGHLCNHPV